MREAQAETKIREIQEAARHPSRPWLSAEDIKGLIRVGARAEWHPQYLREEWRDKDGPLELLDIWKIDDDEWMVMYRCPHADCLGCRHPTSPAGKFHHKLIRTDGFDLIGRGEEVRISKKRTETVLVDQPVFRAHIAAKPKSPVSIIADGWMSGKVCLGFRSPTRDMDREFADECAERFISLTGKKNLLGSTGENFREIIPFLLKMIRRRGPTV